MKHLFEPLTVGNLELPNRVVMAPMTRSRAYGGLVSDVTATYYAQRASAGLIITESTQPSVIGQGYIQTPGLHTSDHVDAWRRVTEAVHAADGRIFVQLTHTGRIGHPSLYPDGSLPVAPSAVASGEQLFSANGLLDHPVPRAMSTADIATTIDDFVSASRRALDAGFDGVELHGANGYLIHQFLADNTNLRRDAYGGALINRIRFARELVEAVTAAIGPERTGLRISPANPFNGIEERRPDELYRSLMHALTPVAPAYVHVVESGDRELTRVVREAWPGRLILNAHPTTESFPSSPEAAADAIRDGVADAVSLATMWLANPDLVARIRAGGPYNSPDPTTYYGGDHRGYVDYPTLHADVPRSLVT